MSRNGYPEHSKLPWYIPSGIAGVSITILLAFSIGSSVKNPPTMSLSDMFILQQTASAMTQIALSSNVPKKDNLVGLPSPTVSAISSTQPISNLQETVPTTAPTTVVEAASPDQRVEGQAKWYDEIDKIWIDQQYLPSNNEIDAISNAYYAAHPDQEQNARIIFENLRTASNLIQSQPDLFSIDGGNGTKMFANPYIMANWVPNKPNRLGKILGQKEISFTSFLTGIIGIARNNPEIKSEQFMGLICRDDGIGFYANFCNDIPGSNGRNFTTAQLAAYGVHLVRHGGGVIYSNE